MSSFSSVRRTWRCSGRAPNSSSKPSRARRATSSSDDLERDPALLGEPLRDPLDDQPGDLLDLRRAQRPEGDDLVDPVEELRQERRLAAASIRSSSAAGSEAVKPMPRLRAPGAEVGGHDDHRVGEVDRPALAVGEPPVVHQLQQDVPDLRVGLLDLVEQDHGVGAPAHRLGQLAAVAVPDVAGGRADQPRDRVRLAVLGHVDADQRLLGREQPLRERLDQLGLADAGRARGTGTCPSGRSLSDSPTRARRTCPRRPRRPPPGRRRAGAGRPRGPAGARARPRPARPPGSRCARRSRTRSRPRRPRSGRRPELRRPATRASRSRP